MRERMGDGMRKDGGDWTGPARGASGADDGLGLDVPDDPALDRFAARVAAPLRTREQADASFKARLMASVRADAIAAANDDASADASAGARRVGLEVVRPTSAAREPWYRRSVTLRLTPLGALAAAAAIAGVAALGALGGRSLEQRGRPAAAMAAAASSLPDTVRVVQFVFVAPGARHVSLVGDFNAWDREATQLRPGGVNGGVWTVSLALPAGRHEYAFVVDGTRWEPDPAATTAVTDDFGVVSSVVSVGATTAPRLGVS